MINSYPEQLQQHNPPTNEKLPFDYPNMIDKSFSLKISMRHLLQFLAMVMWRLFTDNFILKLAQNQNVTKWFDRCWPMRTIHGTTVGDVYAIYDEFILSFIQSTNPFFPKYFNKTIESVCVSEFKLNNTGMSYWYAKNQTLYLISFVFAIWFW